MLDMRSVSNVLILSFLLVFVACNSDDDGSPSSSDNFDRQTLLVNWSENIIIPVYEDLQTELSELQTAAKDFNDSSNVSTLNSLREEWLEAYKVFQYAEMFNIGKAEELNFQFLMNVYPTNTNDIENNIASGNYDLSIPNNNDAVGFPALDYLLHGLGETDAEILSFYNSDANAANRKKYLKDLVDLMNSLTSDILSDWKNNFKTEFIERFGNTTTGSVNLMTNDFIFYYEKLFRANKIGIPAGVFSSTPLPDRVEALYRKEVSKELANEAFKAIRNFFNGVSYLDQSNGTGYDDYLNFLNTIRDGENLSTVINNQFNSAQIKINGLDNNFYFQVKNDNTAMLETYDEIQKAVVLLKVDMLQAFDINVDFVDADGD